MPYGLCKHGPDCNRNQRGQCMYAHSLETLELPQESDYTLQMWYDNSGERGGHPGIDIFYVQMYSEAQRARLELYVNREEPPYPD